MTDWRDSAACRDHDADAWFSDDPYTLAYAISVCQTECPVAAECEVHAQQVRPQFGVWAGKVMDRTKDKDRLQNLAVRTWAVQHGYFDERPTARAGRLPKRVLDAYKEAVG